MTQMYLTQDYIPKNDLEKIVSSLPPDNWNWDIICSSNLISEEFLNKTIPFKYWSFYGLSRNEHLSNQFIQKYIQRDWDIYYLVDHPAMNNNLLKIIIDKRPEWIEIIQRSPLLKIELVKKLSKTPNNNFYSDISANPNLPLKFIEEHIDEKWMWASLSKNPHIKYDFLKKYIDKLWSPIMLAKNPNFNLDWILLMNNHLVLTSDFWYYASEHPNININDLLENPHLSFSWRGFSYNPNITIDLVKKYHFCDWNWVALSGSNKITLKDIDSNFYLPWRWDCINLRRDLTPSFIDKYQSKLDFSKIYKPENYSNADNLVCNSNLYLIQILKNGSIIKSSHEIFTNISSPIKIRETDYKYDTYSNLSRERSNYRLSLIKKDLIETTWKPSRLRDWCLDILELNEFSE